MSDLRERYAKGGQPPLGVTRDGEVHLAESLLVRRVFELVAQGYSSRQTSRVLQERHGEKLDPKQVRRMLHREVYVEAGVIDAELWRRAHKTLESNLHNRKGKP